MKGAKYGQPYLSIFLCTCLNFYSKVFLSPFTVKWDELQKRYKLIPSSFPRKFLCLLVFLGYNLSVCFWAWDTFKNGALLRFQRFQEIGFLLFTTILFATTAWLVILNFQRILWFRQESIVSFLNAFAIAAYSDLDSSSEFKTCPFFPPWTWLVPGGLYAVEQIVFLNTNEEVMTLKKSARFGVDLIALIFGDVEFHPCFGSILDWFFRAIMFLGTAFTAAYHGLFLVLVLTLRQCARKTDKILSGDQTVHKAVQLYDHVLLISIRCNVVFGDLFLLAYVGIVVFMTQTPLWVILIGDTDPVEIVTMFMFLTFVTSLWWSAAEWHRIVRNSFATWVHKRNLQGGMIAEEHLKIVGLSNTLQMCPVALGCRYFCISHRLLCSTLFGILTFGVIVYQLLTPSTQSLIMQMKLNLTKQMTATEF